jgi:ribonucleotide reductase alpha subunit
MEGRIGWVQMPRRLVLMAWSHHAGDVVGFDLAGDLASPVRYRDPQGTLEAGIDASHDRVASALAVVEADPDIWRARFRACQSDFPLMPCGRILAGAGTSPVRTLFHCYVMGAIEDSLEGIFQACVKGVVLFRPSACPGAVLAPARSGDDS